MFIIILLLSLLNKFKNKSWRQFYRRSRLKFKTDHSPLAGIHTIVGEVFRDLQMQKDDHGQQQISLLSKHTRDCVLL